MINQTYNDVMTKLQYYILDEPTIDKSLEMKLYSVSKGNKENKENKEKQQTSIKNKNNDNKIFIPKEKDGLFWCFYIIKNGEVKYETFIHRNDVYSKQIKINYVENIRKDKKTVKIYKFDTISNIESNLVNDNIINNKTFLTLCALENINIIYVHNKTYFELLMNDSSDIFIVYEINNHMKGNYNTKYGYELGNAETIHNIRSTLYKVDKIDKPIKAISGYTTQQLIDICNKLAIDIINKDTNKTKTKKDLYEGIIQYF